MGRDPHPSKGRICRPAARTRTTSQPIAWGGSSYPRGSAARMVKTSYLIVARRKEVDLCRGLNDPSLSVAGGGEAEPCRIPVAHTPAILSQQRIFSVWAVHYFRTDAASDRPFVE